MENEKKAPTWAKIVGIIGMSFGLLGLLGSSYGFMMPTMIEMQRNMMESMKQSAAAAKKERSERVPCPGAEEKNQIMMDPIDMFEGMEKFWDVPPWFKTWSLVSAGSGMILGAGFVLSSILLLTLKAGAPTIFVFVASLNIIRDFGMVIAGFASDSMIVWMSSGTAVVGLLISLVLIIVVVVSDRSDYFNKSTEET